MALHLLTGGLANLRQTGKLAYTGLKGALSGLAEANSQLAVRLGIETSSATQIPLNFQQNLSTTITRRGWLQFHEGTGHTIARHVAKTDAELLGRLSSNSRITASSTFTNQNIAEDVISQTIRQNRPTLNAWLRSNPRANLVLDYSGTTPIGRSAVRGASTAVDVTNARIVLKFMGNGRYKILTAFPR